MLIGPHNGEAGAAGPRGAHAPTRAAAAEDVGIQGDRIKREASRPDPAPGTSMVVALGSSCWVSPFRAWPVPCTRPSD
jgi:hypothetical protein